MPSQKTSELISVSKRIAEKDPEIFDFLQAFFHRPGMYIGSERFDYAFYFLCGYEVGSKKGIDLFPHEEIGYWMLHAYGATLNTGALQARSLFFRLFGFESIAFEKYKQFYKTPLPKKPKCVYNEIKMFQEKHNMVRYNWDDDTPLDYDEKLASAVFENINAMIARADMTYDELKIFIRRESLFCQVRFLVHGSYGWKDDKGIISKPENHDLLVALHANASEAEFLKLQDCGYDVIDDIDRWRSPDHIPIQSKSFYSDYLHWKEKTIES